MDRKTFETTATMYYFLNLIMVVNIYIFLETERCLFGALTPHILSIFILKYIDNNKNITFKYYPNKVFLDNQIANLHHLKQDGKNLFLKVFFLL